MLGRFFKFFERKSSDPFDALLGIEFPASLLSGADEVIE
jgi:hypothetical protein